MTKAKAMVAGCLLCSFFLPGKSYASFSVDRQNRPEYIAHVITQSSTEQILEAIFGEQKHEPDAWNFAPRIQFRNAGNFKGATTLVFQPKEPIKVAFGYNGSMDIKAQLEFKF